MRTYFRGRAYLAAKTFLSENKRLLLAAVLLTFVGVAVGIVLTDADISSTDTSFGTFKVLLFWLATLTVSYALIALATLSKYLVILPAIAFVYLGYRVGQISVLLLADGIGNIISLFTFYLPVSMASVSLMCVAVKELFSYGAGYLCTATTVFKRILVIFAINMVILLIFLLIFVVPFSVTTD